MEDEDKESSKRARKHQWAMRAWKCRVSSRMERKGKRKCSVIAILRSRVLEVRHPRGGVRRQLNKHTWSTKAVPRLGIGVPEPYGSGQLEPGSV